MRVTTPMLYDSGTRGILERQADLLRTQEQLASGRRVLVPSDDPAAAARALAVDEAASRNARFGANAEAARTALATAELAVADLQEALAGTRELVLAAGNGSLTDADRRSLATDLRSRLAAVLEIANRRDGNGRALFAGSLEDAVAFVDDGAGVTYAGDQGVRRLAISDSRLLATGVSGAALFQGIPAGNGTFVTAAGAANSGDGAIGTGSVVDPSLLTGHDYEIVFSVLGATTTYAVVDATLGLTVSSGNPYTSGSAIVFGGQQAGVTGAPAAGDRFAVVPAPRQDLFAALRAAIAVLEAPTASPPARGALASGLERALADIDQAADRALAVRTDLGAGLREVDAARSARDGLAIEHERELSGLRDLDYARAVSDFARQQQALEAAQKAFKGVTQLSLFSLL